MELMIYSPGENETLPEIKWNFEEIKKYAAEKAAWYQNIAYTDADVSDMKKDRADINKFINALEGARKIKKKEYLAPYEVFESQVKEALLPLRKVTDLIGEKLDEVERQYRACRKSAMEVFYWKYVGDLHTLVPFKKTVKEEYYKRAFSDKKLEQAYEDFFGRIREEMQALDELPERFRDKALLKYAESFSLSDALKEGRRLEELEKLLEDRRKKQEAEENQRKAAAQKAAAQTKEIPEGAPVVSVKTQEAEAPLESPAPEPVLHMDFRVYGTREQIMSVRRFLIDNHIKFGKVE